RYKEALFNFPNVHFLSAVPAEELPAYLEGSDILLVPYREAFQQQMANPHKMMEYLGTGRPVVATYTACYSYQDERVIRMAPRNSEFTELLVDTVEHLDEYQDESLVRERKAVVEASSYEERIRQIEGILVGVEGKKA
ncbi:MAG: glycosyltransferase, partial [Flavobacteriales bacterium]